ncbi:MAG TPA: MFS transporter [Steroidobacteraceae bacterium]|nr:MFS transporter [Steroidobacteraceae bacterium]
MANSKSQVRRGPIFTTIALALLMMSVDSTIVSTALPVLQRELRSSINWVAWTLTAYSFGFVLLLPLSGKLSDRYGRRRVFLGSLITFTLASLCCGLVSNIYALIMLRALQGAGGAGFTPSATGIVVDYFGSARDRAVSLFGSIFPVGAMIGPVFGGLFVTYWSWRGIFLVNVPIGALVMVLCLRYVPADQPRTPRVERQRTDVPGMALLGIGMLSGMLAASRLGEGHAPARSALFIVAAALCIVTLSLFFRRLPRIAQPFIAPRLIYGPGFGPVNLINALYGGVTFGVVALIPFYATSRYGISTLESGTLLTAQGIAAATLSIASAMVLRRAGHRPLLYLGSAIMALGILLLAVRPIGGISAYLWLAAAALLIGAGSGTINPPSRNAALQNAPEHSATLAALRTMALQIGSITTVSIATAFLAQSRDPGGVQAGFYLACAALFVVMLPLIARVPEHRGAW